MVENIVGGGVYGGIDRLQGVRPSPGDNDILPIPQADPYHDRRLLSRSHRQPPEVRVELFPAGEYFGTGG